jgi:hypothetical protein
MVHILDGGIDLADDRSLACIEVWKRRRLIGR